MSSIRLITEDVYVHFSNIDHSALIKENNYGLFKKHEFYQAEKPPQKLEKDCMKCPTYRDCKEEAFVYEIKKP